MKYLPCDTRGCQGKPAQTKSGNLMLVGTMTNSTTYKCWRCKRATRFDITRWPRLPEAPLDEVKAMFSSAIDNSVAVE